MAYKNLYKKYGFSPKHISTHIDNYRITTNPDSDDGKSNTDILTRADVIFFNGGDQARHARCWLLDDGKPNDLMQIIRKRALDNSVVLAGTSAGTMIMPKLAYGGGSSFGQLYFA